MTVIVILLAGGRGTRFGRSTPKQYLRLGSKVVARHSFDLFLSLEEVSEIVVVCVPEARHLFGTRSSDTRISFALPGVRRQDSVYNGLLQHQGGVGMVCIHDAARPLVNAEMVRNTVVAAREHGAAVIGRPIPFTIKQARKDGLIAGTLDRTLLWEVQTPQVIEINLLLRAFAYAIEHEITVTDDVSLVEALGFPVKLVATDAHNIKITTPQDWDLVQKLENT